MEIKKIENGCEIKLNENKIYLDPIKIQKDSINILSELTRKINYDKVFNLPGEYEINGIFIRGFRDNDKVIYVLYTRETKIIFVNGEISEEILNEIYREFGEFDIAILKNINQKNYGKIKDKLKFKVEIFLTSSPKKVEKVNSAKINLKKLEEASYLLT